MKPIRNSAKAVVVHDGCLLAIRKKKEAGDYYVLPGGGQEREETLAHAVQRECLEETGLDVDVLDLLFIREYVGKNHEFAAFDSDLHQVEFFFRCAVKNQTEASDATQPDMNQVGIAWLPVADIEIYQLYPKALRPHIAGLENGRRLVYLGDVN